MTTPHDQTVQEQKHGYPWWLSIIVATVLYCLFRYLLPTLSPTHPALQKFFRLAPDIAPVITIPFLLLGAKQLYEGTTPEGDNEDVHQPSDNDEPPKPES